MNRPIFDLQDDLLFQVLEHGYGMDLEGLDKAVPGLGRFVGLLLELAQRLREVRRHCTLEAKDGMVDAARVLELLDGK